MFFSSQRFFASLALGLLVIAALLAWACDSGNPVAPDPVAAPADDASYSVGVSASPSQVVAGSGNPSTITVTVTDATSGDPPADGTQVSVSTDNGDFGAGSDGSLQTLVVLGLFSGTAQASLFPAADLGSATVQAAVGGSTGQTTVTFGESAVLFIQEIDPSTGSPSGGQTVRVMGGAFAEPLRVSFGGVVGEVVSVTSSVIRVTTPAMTVASGASLTVDVEVANALDQSSSQTVTLTGGFTYVDGTETLFVTGVDPNTDDADGGTEVTVTGGGFVAPVRVDFGGKPGINATVESSTEIKVTVPEPDQTVGTGETLTVDVVVNNALDTAEAQTATLTGGLTYIGETAQDTISITSLSPSRGSYQGGTEVTATGQGFPTANSVTVTLAGVSQSGVTVDSSTQLRFDTAGIALSTCPAGGESVQSGITVTDVGTGASGTADLTFTYTVPMPLINRVSPTVGPQLGNTQVNLEATSTGEFEDPVRVVFIAGAEEFTGVTTSVTDSLVRVASPRLPDSVFPEVDCVIQDGDNTFNGKRYTELTVDVQVTNQTTGCSDTFGNAYTYQPTNPNCRQVP
ncbi:MAG: hypothetical protein GY719_14245 [bacterium]|nr:hypothetical protein [bacterium]